MENSYEVGLPYWKWITKKLGDDMSPPAIIQRRTVNTACTVLSTIHGIPFSKLSSSLYFFCSDVEMQEFSRQYEAQLELAGAAPEKFVKGLHSFYNRISNKIKKDNLYADFFDFMALCVRMRVERHGDPSMEAEVLNCYMSLLLQTIEYLRPEKFNFKTVLCGMKTTGELLTTADHFPLLDIPSYRLENAARTGKIRTAEEFAATLVHEYSRAGFEGVRTPDDVELLSNVDRVFSNHVVAMLPFINEYTYDILPTRVFTPSTAPFIFFRTLTSKEQLVEMLRHRSATLPTNGVFFRFSSPSFIHEVQMKEVFYNEKIYMLYRMDMEQGELSGYYDTVDGFLYSVLSEADEQQAYHEFTSVILYLYACAVTRDGPNMLKVLPLSCRYTDPESYKVIPFAAEIFGMGGKLRNVYDKEPDGSRRNSDKYTREERSIQGFIRKVGEGKHPSAQAMEYARALGYELGPDETYVRPFIRHVLRLKEVKKSEAL